jgi:hypothetical protein
LHKRLVHARSVKEAATYGFMINNARIQVTALYLSEQGYDYKQLYDTTLPTTRETYSSIEESLEVLIEVVKLAESSIPSIQDMANEPILPLFMHHLTPTVYTINTGNDEDSD